MEWLWSLLTGLVGWWIGYRQSVEDRKRGIEERVQAAFSMETTLVGSLLERDRKRLKEIFKDVDLGDPNKVREVSQAAGQIYAEIIRRDAFSDARVSNFSRHDRNAWERTFDQEMPKVGYEQGYLQGVRDILKGATEIAPLYFDQEIANSFELWVKRERNLGFSWVDGKFIGAQLLSFNRAERSPRTQDGAIRL